MVRPHVIGCWTEIPDVEHRRRDALAPPSGAPSGPAETHLEIRSDVLIVRDAVITDFVTDLITRDDSWLSNYGQLRRNTDRRKRDRDAQLAFVVAILFIIKLLDQGARKEG